MTFTEAINKVLKRLREDTVASPDSSSYATMIGELVNETKREVEDAWKWTMLRTQIQVTTAASTNGYSITGAGDRYKFIGKNKIVYDSTNNSEVHPGNSAELKKRLLRDTTTGLPMNYYIEGIDSNNDPKVYFYSLPDGVYTMNFDLVVPQDDFSLGSEVFSVPSNPIVLGAYAKAVSERGEDQGRTSGEAFEAYNKALSDAIEIDEARVEDESDWYVD